MTKQRLIHGTPIARFTTISLLLAWALPVLSETTDKTEKKIEKPLLSFAGGLVQFDVESRARFEVRNNTGPHADADFGYVQTQILF